MSKFSGNDAKFDYVRQLNLPIGHFAITSSGVLGIRNIRPIGDVDIIASDNLWSRLSRHHPVTRDHGFDRIAISDYIEIFGRDSFLASRSLYPTVYEQIATAELIQGLPFVRLEHVLHLKRTILLHVPTRTKRIQDLDDILNLERLIAAQTQTAGVNVIPGLELAPALI